METGEHELTLFDLLIIATSKLYINETANNKKIIMRRKVI